MDKASTLSQEAVQPILDSIGLGRTDIIKTLLDEVKNNLEKSGDNPSNKGVIFHFYSHN